VIASRLLTLAFLTLFGTVQTSEAGSIIYGNTIDISGGVRLVNGAICFSDLSCMSTAYLEMSEVLWGQIQGAIEDQLDLSVKFQSKQDLVEKDLPFGYAGLNAIGKVSLNALPALGIAITKIPVLGTTPAWFSDPSAWVDIVEYSTTFNKLHDVTKLSIRFTDNIGVYNNSWCNIGIFIDAVETPICFGAWSGVEFTTVFGQQSLNCTLTGEFNGEHIFTVKHRSQFCMYGNYSTDEYGAMRQLVVQELL